MGDGGDRENQRLGLGAVAGGEEQEREVEMVKEKSLYNVFGLLYL